MMTTEIDCPNHEPRQLQCPHCKHTAVYSAFLGIHPINCNSCKDLFYYYFLDWGTPMESKPKYLVDAAEYQKAKQQVESAKDHINALLQDR